MKRVLMIMCVSMLAASMYASSVRNGGIIHQSIATTSSDPGPDHFGDPGTGGDIPPTNIDDPDVPL